MLYIIVKDYFLAKFVVDALKDREDISTVTYARKNDARGWERVKLKTKKMLRAFHVKKKGLWTTDIFEPGMLEQLKSITKDDRILLWGVENLKELLILRDELTYKSISVFLWNPVATICRNRYSQWEYAHYLNASDIDVFTFDRKDAERYGFNYINQVYRKPGIRKERSVSSDVFFIGQDKSRAAIINDIRKVMEPQGITYDFYIIKDKHTHVIPEMAEYYKDGELSYEESLRLIDKSRCIIELFQKGQGGITLRTLEASFMGKKLITNNADIVNTDLYNPQNIFVWGDKNEKRSLKTFLQAPLCPVSEDVLSKYDVENWIKIFL